MRPRFTPQRLLLLASSFLLRHLLPLSDGAAGFFVGTGLGVELLALYRATRLCIGH